MKGILYLVVLLGFGVDGYIYRHSPRQPDPASGHVIKVNGIHSRNEGRYTLYLTSSERYIYQAGFIVAIAATLGSLRYQSMLRKRNRATSLG